jgi:hypothetical protein
LSAFIMITCWIFSEAFSPSFKMNVWFFYLILFMCSIKFIDMLMVGHPCIPRMKPTCSYCMIFLMFCWNWFSRILLRIFEFVFTKETRVVFLLLLLHTYLV